MNAMTNITADPDQDDDLYARAVKIVREADRASTTFLQKQFGIGYNKAARIIERMEQAGIISAANHVGKRDVLPLAPVSDENPSITISAGGAEMTTTLDQMRKAAEELDRKHGKPPMKKDPDFQKHNDAADELRQFIEQFEQLETEKKDIVEQQKDVMAEAKGRGYDTKVIRKIIAIRKRDKDDLAEEEAKLDLYKFALGMS
ncbi:DUF2312 domain-containing protein [Sinirhodobacter populi]|uniref:DUF2312 domain-containing protein n=2 Tax=Paenirhodobacter populi TaxID=2306993 RepID=A0A443KF57_9RHOB|nr:DUF2312 domain-containing protein [Sinirhodobacter populi]